MKDRDLADQIYHEVGLCGFDPLKAGDNYDYVRDPRPAMAMLEKMTGEVTIWQQTYEDDSPVWIVETDLTNADGRDESLCRAINEAVSEYLSSKACCLALGESNE